MTELPYHTIVWTVNTSHVDLYQTLLYYYVTRSTELSMCDCFYNIHYTSSYYSYNSTWAARYHLEINVTFDQTTESLKSIFSKIDMS